MNPSTPNLALLATAIEQLAVNLHPEAAAALATTLAALDTGDWAYLRARILSSVPQAGLRERVDELLQTWQHEAPGASTQSVALALEAVARGAERARARQKLELVWTGPDSRVIPLRRTDQALLEVIDDATTTLLIVSFAVVHVPEIIAALTRALHRGVRLTICPETDDHKIAGNTLQTFGPELVHGARFCIWPAAKRPRGPAGRYGALHAKTAVADRRLLFISSANLTGHALTLNMELGVLIYGGELPAQVEDHFDQLIERGVLERILPSL